MISIYIPEREYYDDDTNTFYVTQGRVVNFEYCLLAISKWESKWKIPFLSSNINATDPKLLDFYIMMSDDPTLIPQELTKDVIMKLKDYMEDTHTATTFNDNGHPSGSRSKTYTSEEFYALMAMNGVPIEFEKRHLSNLLAILRIISIYNDPNPKKMSKTEVMSQNAKLNELRKKQYGTKG